MPWDEKYVPGIKQVVRCRMKMMRVNMCDMAKGFLLCIIFSSVQFSHSVVSNSLWPQGLQHARLLCPSLAPRDYSNLCPRSQWCHPTISSSVVLFCLQSFPASGSFPMSQLFASGGQSIGVSASAPLLPTNTQDWFPLGWTSWISLQSTGLSRVFSNWFLKIRMNYLMFQMI